MSRGNQARHAQDAAVAWTRSIKRSFRHRPGRSDWSSVLAPSVFFVLALGLLTYDHVRGAVSEVFFWLSVALIIAVFAWMLERVGRSARLIASQRSHLLRDPLTEIGNAGALREDLTGAIDARTAVCLLMLEVEESGQDPADEALERKRTIRRIAHDLQQGALTHGGQAYRLAGMRFAMLAPADGRRTVDELVTASRAALGRDSTGALISASHGAVLVPEQTNDAERALDLGDEDLKARKQRGRRSARRQAHAALVAAIGSRRPALREHLRSVVPLVITVGRRLGLDQEDLDDVVLAAGLQDAGMLTVPEHVLERTGPLTKSERDLIRRHPVAGERIVSSAPSLTPVARLVRSAYERFDGTGYPDGLAGADIPLGSRIIGPCVAAAAMNSVRPHRGALGPEATIEELRNGAGAQFDPNVIEILTEELLGSPDDGNAPPAPRNGFGTEVDSARPIPEN